LKQRWIEFRIGKHSCAVRIDLVEQAVRAPNGKPDYRWAQQAALSGCYHV
jgi:hypothetical protein